MPQHRSPHTTVPVGAIAPKPPAWAGPGRTAGSLTTSARSGSLGVIKFPVALGD
ncbi:hypothetical protein ACFO1B_04560 [Dactylosporangium siamense]|uniref:Uncharacterized protein n=1 Tax=Dactylosporangium siamense TaxID=685454 RepID=A0A919PDL7_9ACTN|nr:hypothetical protein [Dactylosporangium siamense]GIG42841.1 hypothetical protein Dsi01nite_008820 [Dactylosporangium siamense]